MLLESFEKAASNNDSRMVALRGGRGGGEVAPGKDECGCEWEVGRGEGDE